MKLNADKQTGGHLSQRLDPPHPVMESFLGVEVPDSPVGEYVLRCLDAALARDDGRLQISFNYVQLEGDRSVVRLADDDTFVPDAARCELPTPEFRRLLSEWLAALKAHGL